MTKEMLKGYLGFGLVDNILIGQSYHSNDIISSNFIKVEKKEKND